MPARFPLDSMPIYRAPLADYRFVIDHFLEIDQYHDLPGYAELTPELRSVVLEQAARFCEEHLHKLNAIGDREGCRFENGVVHTPTGFRQAYRTYVDGGWMSLSQDPLYGGQGLPRLMSVPLSEMLVSANMGFSGYVDITQAAATCLHAHGSADQKRRYLPKLVTGEWGGAMHLTEPQAGTDVGRIRTRAMPQADGSFRLHGAKIFITGVEQDLTENVINLVLARMPEAPSGSNGLSLFVVPKYLVDASGQLSERNPVRVTGIEHKMGVRASATCSVEYDGAFAELIGLPHQGLAAMFTMMNDTRLGVGLQGLGISEIALQNAATYARERRQGRAPGGSGSPRSDADPIVLHPDVRRMLLQIKAFVEGARALAAWCALEIDLSRLHPDRNLRLEAADFVQLLTPVIKAYFTDQGFKNANLALQCFGGYGYIVESGIEQFVRDIRIGQIYEGTNGIQALDLARRKLFEDNGRLPARFFALVRQRVVDASAQGMGEFALPLDAALTRLIDATDWMRRHGSNPRDVAAGASDLLRLFAVTAMGWAWSGLALAAHRQLTGNRNQEFCRNKIATGQFFMSRMAPEAELLRQRATTGSAPLFAVAL